MKNLSTRLRPINTLLKQGVKLVFTPEMGVIVRDILHELATPPILVYPDWDAVADNSRSFHLYYDASIDGFSATLEQEQPDGSVRPIVFINRTTLDNERSWTPFYLEVGSIVWAIKRLRGHLWSTNFLIYSDHNALENITKVGDHNASVQLWKFLSAYSYTLEYRKGSSNGNADFLSRLPQPATDLDRTGPNRLTSLDTISIHLIQACSFTAIEPFTLGIGLGGLAPPAFGSFDPGPPFPCTNNDFGDYRRHGPHMDAPGSAQVTWPFATAIAAPNPAAGSLHSLPLGSRFPQAPAAGLPRSLPLGPQFAQGLTTDSPRRVYVGPRYDQDPATALPNSKTPAWHRLTALLSATALPKTKAPLRHRLAASPPATALSQTNTPPRHRPTAFPPAIALSRTKTSPRHRFTAFPPATTLPKAKTPLRHRLTALPSTNE